MELIIEDLTAPANPTNFVGRSTLIQAYSDVLKDFVRSNSTVRWVHISGNAGTGKSSLLRKLRMTTEQERIATGSVEIPISPYLANQFLTDVKQMIDEMTPEWRGFFKRRSKAEIAGVAAPPEANKEQVQEEHINKLVEYFFEDLDEVNSTLKEHKMRNAIFLDNIDRFLNYGYSSILNVIPIILKKFKELDYNLIFVTSSHYRANRFLKIQEAIEGNYLLHLELNQFDFNEAELMIRRKGKLVRADREKVVQSSTRYPFDLSLRQFILSKGMDPAKLNAQIITEAFGLESDEVNLLRDLSKSDINYFDVDTYTRMHDIETINNLKNSLLFNISQDDHFIIESYALWELISQIFKPIDPRTEVILILNRVKEQAEESQLASMKDMKVIREHFASIENEGLIFELSGQLADTAKAALEGGLIKTAWDLLSLATFGLEKTKDYEKIADLHETLAKSFANADQDYFAAKVYFNAAHYYELAGIEWKSIANYREAGIRYQKEAENMDVNLYHYAIRNILKKSIKAFVSANETKKAKAVKETGITILKDYDNHIKYFEKLTLKGDN
jgi:hypothetical protein